ncbi:MAG: hypothetical protein R3E97_24410 [Candidatus Eisenbacteria bacterium]
MSDTRLSAFLDARFGISMGVADSAPRLPRYLNEFVGREADLEAVLGLIRASRLVTLVGPAGVGKTRLDGRSGGADGA